jgi:hypothetical protein
MLKNYIIYYYTFIVFSSLNIDFYAYLVYHSCMDKILNLLDQVIEYNIYLDNKTKKDLEAGDSFTVHHLKLLKALIEEYEKK